ncbi:MAG: hypothetical protein QNJ31_00555 [Candidatus Caenarcaniphilales bacterium]|nr:hypothetical protein [Candidatus Caenarcaniphilales bacterium]
MGLSINKTDIINATIQRYKPLHTTSYIGLAKKVGKVEHLLSEGKLDEQSKPGKFISALALIKDSLEELKTGPEIAGRDTLEVISSAKELLDYTVQLLRKFVTPETEIQLDSSEQPEQTVEISTEQSLTSLSNIKDTTGLSRYALEEFQQIQELVNLHHQQIDLIEGVYRSLTEQHEQDKAELQSQVTNLREENQKLSTENQELSSKVKVLENNTEEVNKASTPPIEEKDKIVSSIPNFLDVNEVAELKQLTGKPIPLADGKVLLIESFKGKERPKGIPSSHGYSISLINNNQEEKTMTLSSIQVKIFRNALVNFGKSLLGNEKPQADKDEPYKILLGTVEEEELMQLYGVDKWERGLKTSFCKNSEHLQKVFSYIFGKNSKYIIYQNNPSLITFKIPQILFHKAVDSNKNQFEEKKTSINWYRHYVPRKLGTQEIQAIQEILKFNYIDKKPDWAELTIKENFQHQFQPLIDQFNYEKNNKLINEGTKFTKWMMDCKLKDYSGSGEGDFDVIATPGEKTLSIKINHALGRMIERGISPTELKNMMKKAVYFQEPLGDKDDYYLITPEGCVIIVEENGTLHLKTLFKPMEVDLDNKEVVKLSDGNIQELFTMSWTKRRN